VIFATYLNVEHQNYKSKALEVFRMNLLETLLGKPVSNLSVVELDKKLKNGKRPLVLDVRQPEEYHSGHIAGAKLIPLGELRTRIQELPQSQEIVCVCASGSRSSSATRTLVGAGLNAVNMKGGMFAWRQAKLPVKKGDAA
jgi:rhodanese-related sulfurtransferase